MRAMEYTPTEAVRHSCDGGWRYWCLACAGDSEPDLTAQKHLTDAECAAEYWQAEAEHTGMRNGEGAGWSSAEVMAALEREVSTWHRFATQPHASEVEA